MIRVIAVLLLLAGCADGPTRGDSCAVVANALCSDVAPECASFASDHYQECFSWAMGWCCDDASMCSAPARDPDLEACDKAVRAEDCSNDIVIPEECGL